jgi:hypothetical protein
VYARHFPILPTLTYPDFLRERNLDDVDNILPHEVMPRKSLLRIWYVVTQFAERLVSGFYASDQARRPRESRTNQRYQHCPKISALPKDNSTAACFAAPYSSAASPLFSL